RATPEGRPRRLTPRRTLSVDPRDDLSRVRSGGPVLAADRAPRGRDRLRRLPRPPSVPARAGGAAPRPAGPAPARLHLPHALREVRALRAAQADRKSTRLNSSHV